MASDPFMVKVRLTKEQASVIWPGLDLIFQSYLIRSQTGRSSHIYPFGTYPLPYGYDTGSFSQEIMDRMRAFYDRLKPKARKGGRIQMDYIDLRVAILSVRVTVDFERERARKWRQCDDAAKRRLRVDRESIRRLEKKAQRVIKSLERKLKFANRRFLSRNSRYQYQSMSKQWSSHLRWIRFELAYSKPLPPITRGRKKWHQWLIDNLVALAEDVIRSEVTKYLIAASCDTSCAFLHTIPVASEARPSRITSTHASWLRIRGILMFDIRCSLLLKTISSSRRLRNHETANTQAHSNCEPSCHEQESCQEAN